MYELSIESRTQALWSLRGRVFKSTQRTPGSKLQTKLTRWFLSSFVQLCCKLTRWFLSSFVQLCCWNVFQATIGSALYPLPWVSMAKAVLTVLLASATAAHFLPRLATRACIQASFLVTVVRLPTWATTAIAPVMSGLLSKPFFTYLPILYLSRSRTPRL